MIPVSQHIFFFCCCKQRREEKDSERCYGDVDRYEKGGKKVKLNYSNVCSRLPNRILFCSHTAIYVSSYRWTKSIGLGFKTPLDAKDGVYIDKKCPWAGTLLHKCLHATRRITYTGMLYY